MAEIKVWSCKGGRSILAATVYRLQRNDYRWINNSTEPVGIIEDLSLHVYLCDISHYPEYSDIVNLYPKALQMQNWGKNFFKNLYMIWKSSLGWIQTCTFIVFWSSFRSKILKIPKNASKADKWLFSKRIQSFTHLYSR